MNIERRHFTATFPKPGLAWASPGQRSGETNPLRMFFNDRVLTTLRILIVLATGLTLASLSSSAQTTKHVATGQDLQSALTEAAESGTDYVVNLAAGTYSANFNFNTTGANNLTLQGETGVTNSQIFVDGAGGSMSLKANGNANITVKGITFARQGGTGLYISTDTGADVQIQDFVFAPTTTGGGGDDRSIVSAQNAAVSGCTAAGGGLIGGGLTATGLAGDLTMFKSSAISNIYSVITSVGNRIGGGLYAEIIGNINVSNNVFIANVSDHWGSAAHLSGGGVSLVGNVFNNNVSNYGYKSVAGYANSLSAANNAFSGNQGKGLSFGAREYVLRAISFMSNSATALSATGTTGTLSGNTFAFNSTAAYVQASALTVRENLFLNNSQESDDSAAEFDFRALSASSKRFAGNGNISANPNTGRGGAMYCRGSALSVSNNVFTGNSGSYDGGAPAVYARESGETKKFGLSGNTVRKNAAGVVGSAVSETSGRMLLANNLLANNSAAIRS